jgi:hypothetical protein
MDGVCCPPRRKDIGRGLCAVTDPATSAVGGPAAMTDSDNNRGP